MSAPSPATGTVTSKRDAGGGDTGKRERGEDKSGGSKPGDRATASGVVEIELHHARNHHLRWVVIGTVLGGLCVTQLGTLGQGVGVILIALAAWAAFRVVQTLRHPPGTIIVDGPRVILPHGLCRGEPLHLRRADIGPVYLLRKAVAWHQAAPVLVVETGSHVLAYPRDWFATEADQRRVLDALAGEQAAEPAA